MGELDPRIRIRAPLRCDGIGRLDCAEDAESGVRLAVRWLPLEANGESAVAACQKLPQHPTLPRIRLTGKVGASAYVAMDFPEGELLAAREGEAVNAEQLKWIIAQISDALATMHAQSVFHGEMSAESILLVKPAKGSRSGSNGNENEETAYLWDMPLVIANRLTDRRGEERLMHQLVRTAAFLAPERARGEKPTSASDVYALAAIACIAGGSPKPQSETTLGVVHQVAMGTFRPKVPASMSEPHKGMLERMLSADPKARPSAQVVADVFAPPSNTPTLREMPAISWPPASGAVTTSPVPARDPRPSMPKGPSSWTAMPAITSAPAAPVFKPSAPSPTSKSDKSLKAVAISPETPVAQVAPDAAPTPPAAPVMEALLKSSEAKPPAAPEKTAPLPAHPVAAAPEQTAPVPASPPKSSARPAPPMVESSAMVESQNLSDEEVPEASADDVVDTTAPVIDVKKAQAQAETQAKPDQAPTPKAEPVSVEPMSDPNSIALSDNVRVTPELVDQGAKALTDEESREMKLKQRLPWIIGGASLLVVGALAAVAISMAAEPKVTVVHRQQRSAVIEPEQKAAAAPAADDGDDDDDLLATPTRAKRMHKPAVAAPAAAKPSGDAKAAPATGEKQIDSSIGTGERDPDLDDADAPLKRPMF
ncbi:MAG: protein kinase [Myxococcaceae bacterium]